MNSAARSALAEIQSRVDSDDYILHEHFTQRLDERAAFFPEVLAIIESPQAMRTDGIDKQGRPRWFLSGDTTVGALEVLIVVDTGFVWFWTIYWK